MEWQFASQAYQARAQQLLAQQCINAFVEPTPPVGKTQFPVYGNPGLSTYSRAGNGPINGMHIMAGDLYYVSGGALYKISRTDALAAEPGAPVTSTLIGQTTLGGLLSMADNFQQLVMVDGNVAWIYQPGGLNQVTTASAVAGDTSIPANITGTITNGDTLTIPLDNGVTFTTTASATVTHLSPAIQFNDPLPSAVTAGAIITDPSMTLARITAPAFMPATTVRYFDGYFVFSAKGTRQFFISAINDGTQYSGLDFATATAGSDFIVAIEVYHEQLLIFCQYHTEIWWNAGASSFPFQRYDAAEIARGLSSPLAVVSEDNTVFWMGDDGIFYRLFQFLPQRVSTFAMEHAWAQYRLRYLDCSAFVLDQEGHKWIIINFPSGPGTWAYDISTNYWQQRESWGTPWV